MGIITGIYYQALSGAFHTLPHNLLSVGGARSKAVPDTNAKQVNVAQSVDVLKQPASASNSSLEDFFSYEHETAGCTDVLNRRLVSGFKVPLKYSLSLISIR